MDVVDLAKRVISFNTENPPGNEKELTTYVAEILEGIGVKTAFYEVAPNRSALIGRLPGAVPKKLIFNSHTDVVPAGDGWTHPPFAPVVRGGNLYGRGACDMKGALAAMVCSLERLAGVSEALRPTVELHLVPDEEDAGLGARFLIEQVGVEGDAAIFGEPSGNKVVIAEKGAVWVRFSFTGRSAHGSQPQRGENAISKAAKAIERLEAASAQVLKGRCHSLVGSATINIGTIHGGTRVNTVPDKCEFMVDRRLLPSENAEDAVREMQEWVGDLGSASIVSVDEPAEVSENAPIVVLARRVVTRIAGEDGGLHGFYGSTDARFYIRKAGIPSVVIGPGDLDYAHQADEFVPVDELKQAVDIYTGIALAMAE